MSSTNREYCPVWFNCQDRGQDYFLGQELGGLDDFPVVVVQSRLQSNKSRQAAGHFGHVSDFVRGEAAAEVRLWNIIKYFYKT